MTIQYNNPGYMRKTASDTWQGELPGINVGNFLQFDKLSDGYRAMLKDFQTKIGRGTDTPAKIITAWTPDNTKAYIDYVTTYSELPADKKLTSSDLDTLGLLAYNMTFWEHGLDSDDGTMQDALTEAKKMLKGIITTLENNPGKTLVVISVIALGLYIFSKN